MWSVGSDCSVGRCEKISVEVTSTYLVADIRWVDSPFCLSYTAELSACKTLYSCGRFARLFPCIAVSPYLPVTLVLQKKTTFLTVLYVRLFIVLFIFWLKYRLSCFWSGGH